MAYARASVSRPRKKSSSKVRMHQPLGKTFRRRKGGPVYLISLLFPAPWHELWLYYDSETGRRKDKGAPAAHENSSYVRFSFDAPGPPWKRETPARASRLPRLTGPQPFAPSAPSGTVIFGNVYFALRFVNVRPWYRSLGKRCQSERLSLFHCASNYTRDKRREF